MIEVILKNKRERSVLQGNPWIFSGSIDRMSGTAAPGSMCLVKAADGSLLGSGYCNTSSAITIRMLTRGKNLFTPETLYERISAAFASRALLLDAKTDSCRLIHSEGDFLPGLIVDKYAEGLVVQVLTAGMELMRESIIDSLEKICSPKFVFERSDTEARTREGLPPAEGLLSGTLPENPLIRENDLSFHADIQGGQKTGYFFDQRDNRRLLKHYAKGRYTADCFCYSGSFTIAALAAGAKFVDAMDQSEKALELLTKNAALNGFTDANFSTTRADIFTYLRQTDKKYDLIILDPPKFARHPKEVERASRGYKDINLQAMKKISPGGIIFTFSCSHAIDSRLFRQIVFAASADSGRSFQLLHTLSPGPDHPVNLAHREGDYLKGLVLRAEDIR